jgi:hypothetical protein
MGACAAATSDASEPTANVSVALQVGTDAPVLASAQVPAQSAGHFAEMFRANYQRIEAGMIPSTPNLEEAKVSIFEGTNLLAEGPLKLRAGIRSDVLAPSLASAVTSLAQQVTSESRAASSPSEIGEVSSADMDCDDTKRWCDSHCVNGCSQCWLVWCLCEFGPSPICGWY